MNKHYLFIFLLGVILSPNMMAQTEKGNSLIGGTAGLDIQVGDDATNIQISPNYGVFVIDDIAVGGALTLAYSKFGDVSSTTFGLQPFGRYYMDIGSGPKFFLQAHLGYFTSKTESDNFDITSNGASFGGGAGLAFFLNDHVAIEGILDFTRLSGDFDSSNLTLGFGVQAYLGGGSGE